MKLNDMRRFYEAVDDVRGKQHLFLLCAMTVAGSLLTDKTKAAARWRKYFEVLLNSGNGRWTSDIPNSNR